MSHEVYHVGVEGQTTCLGHVANGRLRTLPEDPQGLVGMLAEIARDPVRHFRNDYGLNEPEALRTLEAYLGDVDLRQLAADVEALRARLTFPFDQRFRCKGCGGFHSPDYYAAQSGRSVHAVYDTSGTGSPEFKGFCGPLTGFEPTPPAPLP